MFPIKSAQKSSPKECIKRAQQKVPKIVQVLLKVPRKGPKTVLKFQKKHFKHSWDFGNYMSSLGEVSAAVADHGGGDLHRV